MDPLPKIDWRPHGEKAHSAAARVVVLYLAISLTWILLSDSLVAQLASDPREIQHLQTLKGWVFVLATGLIFYGLVYRRVKFALRSEAVERLAMYDAVTGLPNGALVSAAMHQGLRVPDNEAQTLWVFAIQLHEFQRIGDSLGSETGNRVLAEAAVRIRGVLSPGDLLARHEGATFLAVVPAQHEPGGRGAIVSRLRRAFEQPLLVAEEPFHLSVRIGASEFPHDGGHPEELIGHAIAAMHRAVQIPGIDAFDYTARFRREAMEAYKLESGLHRALHQGDFTLLYQPQIALADGTCTGVEALIRWRHPELGDISPARFIPLAEQSELIFALGDWVLRQACRQALAWDGTPAGNLRVAINLSSRQFTDPELPCRVESTLRESGLSAERLEIEITETAAMDDPEAAMAMVRRLHAIGVCVAIDDFGTGHSSLAYLRDFAVDRLKIDRGFVAGIPGNAGNLELCRAILGLGRSLGITCLAEGVERPEEVDALRQHGCSEAQGYLFAKPMTPAALLQWLGPRPQSAMRRGAG